MKWNMIIWEGQIAQKQKFDLAYAHSAVSSGVNRMQCYRCKQNKYSAHFNVSN